MTTLPAWCGSLDLAPAEERPDLLAEVVLAALRSLPAEVRSRVRSAPIDPGLADTAAFCENYGIPLAASANCVIALGRREGAERFAAAVVLATSRADINGVVRRQVDVRKISFAPMDKATQMTGMEYGGITPLGLPVGWPVLLDGAVASAGPVVIGSGLRRSKIVVDGADLACFPRVAVLDHLTI